MEGEEGSKALHLNIDIFIPYHLPLESPFRSAKHCNADANLPSLIRVGLAQGDVVRQQGGENCAHDREFVS